MRARTFPARLTRLALLCAGGIVLLLTAVLLLRGTPAALSASLSPLETRVYGQSQWLSGGPAALRIILMDHKMNVPVRGKVAVAVTRRKAPHCYRPGSPILSTCL